jgi:hypothetical protein
VLNPIVAACAEFPNDNPALHLGAIWRCCDALSAPICERPPRAPHDGPSPSSPGLAQTWMAPIAPDAGQTDGQHEHDGIEIVDELTFDDAIDEAEAGGYPVAPQTCISGHDDPFAILVGVLEEVLRAQGTEDDRMTSLRALLGVTRLEGLSVGEIASEALIAGNVVVPAARGLSRSESFTAQLRAWQGILRGESEDFGACGSTPLDQWAADVVARVLGYPARAEGIRRELRRRGVAAFGLVADAA